MNSRPKTILPLGAAYNVATIDIGNVSAFLGRDESVSISSSTDGVSFSDDMDGTGGTSVDFMGWYIDDVVVTETTP